MHMSLCLIPGSRAPIGLQEAGADLESVCLGGGGGGGKIKSWGGGGGGNCPLCPCIRQVIYTPDVPALLQ